jgi:uncharacterized membrane protein
VFAGLAGILGLVLVFLTPLFQVPDEPNHAYRAYQVSRGGLVAEMKDGRVGGEVPSSLIESARTLYALTTDKTSRFRMATLHRLQSKPLNPSTRRFVGFPNTALYSPLVYLPQAVGMAVGRLFDLSAPTLCYIGRICNLLVWVALVSLAIRITPVYKWLFFVLALMPMSLFMAASLSADTLTNGLMFLAVALFLKLGLDPQQGVGKREVLALLAIVILIPLLKTGYFPILLLFFLIPGAKFTSRKVQFALFGLLVTGAFLASSAWATFGKVPEYLQAFVTRLSPVQNADHVKQLQFILSDVGRFAGILFHTISVHFGIWTHHFVGVLGWLDVLLPQSMVYFGFGIILFLSWVEARPDINLRWNNKVMLALYAGITSGIIITSQYLTWTPVGAPEIRGIQGRYFIPIAPAFFSLLYNRRLCRITPQKALPWIAVASVLILFASACVALFARYYDRASF